MPPLPTAARSTRPCSPAVAACFSSTVTRRPIPCSSGRLYPRGHVPSRVVSVAGRPVRTPSALLRHSVGIVPLPTRRTGKACGSLGLRTARVLKTADTRRSGCPRRAVVTACWSLEVSLATSVFVAATVTALMLRGDARARGHAIFLGVFGSMQLIDALLWYDATLGPMESCDMLNRVITRLGICIICCEPLAALWGAYRISGRKHPPNALIALYVSVFLLTPLAGASVLALGDETIEGACQSPLVAPEERVLPCDGRSTCRALFDVSTPVVCSTITPQHHIQYGGLDVVYHRLLTPMDRTDICRLQSETGTNIVFRGSREIPILLRLTYLAGMAVPYALLVKPASNGLAHAGILTTTWLVGLASDGHASVWCLANVAQGILMLTETRLWPNLLKEDQQRYRELKLDSGAVIDGLLNLDDAHIRTIGPHDEIVDVTTEDKLQETSRSGSQSNGGHRVMAMDVTEEPQASSEGRAAPTGAKALKKKEKKRPYRSSDVPQDLDAIVIGSGIGGLTTAALLSKAGKRVLVLEAHYRPGGCTHAFYEVGDNVFDSGIHYVGGAEGPMRFLLSHVCSKPLQLAFMGSPDDGYTYDTFDLGGGVPGYPLRRDRLAESLIEHFPHEAEGIKLYLDQTDLPNYLMYTKFIPDTFPFAKAIRGWLWDRVRDTRPEITAEEQVAKFVKDPALRALLSGGQIIDWNLAPNRVSHLVAEGMMAYYRAGGLYPAGSSNTIADSIIPIIEEAGGKVLCGAPVASILTESTGPDDTGGPSLRAVGVRLAKSGDTIRAPIVVSGIGYYNTFHRLLSNEQRLAAGIDTSMVDAKLGNSHSHICAYISLDGPPEAFDLKPWNIHSMPDLPKYDYNISAMQEDFYRDPFSQKECLMTLTCPSAKDKFYAKDLPGRSNVLLLIEGMPEWFRDFDETQHGRRTDDYKQLKESFKPLFLERLYKYYPKTEGHITHIEISTPLSAEHFINSPEGASYGLEWTPEHFERELHEEFFNPTVQKVGSMYMTGEAVAYGGFYGALATGYATASHILGLPQLLFLLARNRGVDPELLE